MSWPYPSTTAGRAGSFGHNQKVEITCKVHGRSVDGNDLWYAVDNPYSWVSARYLANVGRAPEYCGLIVHQPERTLATLNERVAPSIADPKAGQLAKGVSVQIVCQLEAQKVGGSEYWDYLTDSRWVSAAYLGGYEGSPINYS